MTDTDTATHLVDPTSVPAEVLRELAAMQTAVAALEPLEPAARCRALAWLVDVFMVPLGEPDHFEPVQTPDEAAQRAVVAAAAEWAAQVVDEISPAELESQVLEAQSWGGGPGMIEGALPLISARLRRLAEAAVAEGETPWPST